MDTEKLKAKIEAVLFCLPRGISAKKFSQILGADSNMIKVLLEDLQREYAERSSGLQIEHNSKLWAFKVPHDFTEIIKDAADPELDAAVLETLAYIAWRKGSRQCDVVRVRSNKAYNHIKMLKELGFIESSRAGLSKWLEPTRKFYEYFNMDEGAELKLPEEPREQLQQAELDAFDNKPQVPSGPEMPTTAPTASAEPNSQITNTTVSKDKAEQATDDEAKEENGK